jgi:hypothetical protein
VEHPPLESLLPPWALSLATHEVPSHVLPDAH